MQQLIKIQQQIKVPKNQYNNFGNYKYRNCEDILEALKPLLAENSVAIVINDEIVLLESRFYVKSTATLYSEDGKIIASSSAYAREENERKGMDTPQITGSASSYARKYALNGLFAIDDIKDADSLNKIPRNNVKRAKEPPAKTGIKEQSEKKFPEQDAFIGATEQQILKKTIGAAKWAQVMTANKGKITFGIYYTLLEK